MATVSAAGPAHDPAAPPYLPLEVTEGEPDRSGKSDRRLGARLESCLRRDLDVLTELPVWDAVQSFGLAWLQIGAVALHVPKHLAGRGKELEMNEGSRSLVAGVFHFARDAELSVAETC